MTPPNLLGLRGGPRLSLYLRRVVGDYARSLIAEAQPDVRVSFNGFDRYWMRVFFRGDFYEPELHRLFERIVRIKELDFIDGGANIGFWSAVLTSSLFGVRRAVAVEASASTYPELRRTAELCSDRFATEHKALSARPGVVVFEEGIAAASRHIVAGASDSTSTQRRIEATTIDTLVERYGLDAGNLLVKLDVEGAEIDCFDGASAAFAAGAIFIYEDHGKEPASRVTGALLERGAACWFIRDDGTLAPIMDAASASAVKTDRGRGYNFLCTSATYAARRSLESRLFAAPVTKPSTGR